MPLPKQASLHGHTIAEANAIMDEWNRLNPPAARVDVQASVATATPTPKPKQAADSVAPIDAYAEFERLVQAEVAPPADTNQVADLNALVMKEIT